MNGRPPTPGQDKDKDKDKNKDKNKDEDKMDGGNENNKKKLPQENQKGSDPLTRNFFLIHHLPRREEKLQKIQVSIYHPDTKQPVIFMSANTLIMVQKRRKIRSASIAKI